MSGQKPKSKNITGGGKKRDSRVMNMPQPLMKSQSYQEGPSYQEGGMMGGDQMPYNSYYNQGFPMQGKSSMGGQGQGNVNINININANFAP